MNIPKDPVILLSFINTKLRDEFDSLELLCANMQIDCTELESSLAAIDYHYDAKINQFV